MTLNEHRNYYNDYQTDSSINCSTDIDQQQFFHEHIVAPTSWLLFDFQQQLMIHCILS